jgi:tetratricopeptide (TPR) repeat protein
MPMDLSSAIEWLRRLKPALEQRDRAPILQLCRTLLDGEAPIEGQWRPIARVLLQLGALHDARRAMALLVDQSGGAAGVRFEQAVLLAQTGHLSEAWTVARELPEDVPSLADRAYFVGTTALNLGHMKEARSALSSATAIRPGSGQAWLALSSTGSMGGEAGDRLIAAAPALTEASWLERATYLYAVGKVHGDRGEHDRAWRAFRDGAAIAAAHRPHDRAADARSAEQATVGWTAETLDAFRAPHRSHGQRPIFVLGLPRSGTTLVQTILTAHSTVTAGDELGALSLALRTVRAPLEQVLARPDDAERVVALYAELAAERLGSGPRFVDKSLDTSRLLGIAAAILPQASFVWVRRDPLDCAWSCFRTWFSRGIDWSWSLSDIADHFRIESGLMRHWQTVLGRRLLLLDYEALVDEPEIQIKRLLDHCGLAHERGPFAPHEAAGDITTASVSQVREPINRKGIGASAPYRAHLPPLLEELGRA